MRWIAEEEDERIVKLYGKPTPAQLARAASRIEASCRAFVECADTALRSSELNISNPLLFKEACKDLDHAAAEIRVWVMEGGYEGCIDTEQNIQKMEEMIDDVDRIIADLRNDPTLSRMFDAVEQIKSLSRAFYDCAGAAARRHEQIYSFSQFERAYPALLKSAENLWAWMQRCLQPY